MSDRSIGTRRVAGNDCLNLRDLGGLPVAGRGYTRRGFLMRSSALLPDATGALGNAVLRLGLRSYVDLRTSAEAVRDGWDVDLEALGLTRITAPLSIPGFGEILGDAPQPSDYARAYVRLLQGASGQIAEVLDIIAQAQWPLVFGCSLGKDRTSVISALVLTGRGVRPAHVCNDHALSQRQLGRAAERLTADRERKGLSTHAYARRLAATPASMMALLEWWAHQHAPDQRAAVAQIMPRLHVINERWPLELAQHTS